MFASRNTYSIMKTCVSNLGVNVNKYTMLVKKLSYSKMNFD